MMPSTPTPDTLPQLGRSTAASVAVALVGLASAAAILMRAIAFGTAGFTTALVVFGLAVALIFRGLPGHLPQRRFGMANQVTLVRLVLVSLLAGACAVPDKDSAWWLVLLATAAVALDGVDGALARKHGTASAFGTRFDMETDALLIIVLCVAAWQLEKAGLWVLASGMLRYLFVAAARPWPWLARELPASGRRKLVCVVQIVTLVVCVSPVLLPPLSTALAAIGLGLLCYSFAVDIAWLRRHSGEPLEETAL
jgi:phosphatidylglycerophosphate synthase